MRMAAIALTAALLAGCPGPGEPHVTEWADEAHPAGDAPRIDIAFVIDATGSMQDEIDAAKAKVREIMAWVASGRPRPSVRVAVVAYRDRDEEYVTRLYGFSTDAARAESALATVRAVGGGDSPEHVVAGLRRAVQDLSWDEKAAIRMLFLLGDAGPHLDYGSDSAVEPVLAGLKAKRIVVGAIACGDMAAGGRGFWEQVARETGGPFETIASHREIDLESIVLEAIRAQAVKKGIAY